MTIRTVLVVLLAAVFGLSATLAVRHFASKGEARERTSVEMVNVVVAADDIPKFKVITKDMVKVVAKPKEGVQPGTCTSLEQVLDRGVKAPILKGRYLDEEVLFAKGVQPTVASTIPVGMRAYTIMTPNAASAVAGFVLPGNKVDVLITTTEWTGTLLSSVEIFAVNQLLDTPTDKVGVKDMLSVTLLVKPDQAAILDLGQSKGKLRLSLRNPYDTEETDTSKTLARLKTPAKVDSPETKPEVVDVKPEVVAVKPEPKEVTPKEDPKRGPLHTLRIVQGESVTIAEYDLEAPPGTAAKVTPLKTPMGKEKK